MSTLLAFGWLPFDRHHLTLVSVGERSFVEESWSWLQRRWRHERTITAEGEGCVVTDRLVVEPRDAPRALVEPVVRTLFGPATARSNGVSLESTVEPRGKGTVRSSVARRSSTCRQRGGERCVAQRRATSAPRRMASSRRRFTSSHCTFAKNASR